MRIMEEGPWIFIGTSLTILKFWSIFWRYGARINGSIPSTTTLLSVELSCNLPLYYYLSVRSVLGHINIRRPCLPLGNRIP
jgi:hypothetical protein